MRFHVRVRVALLVLVLLAIDGGSGLLRRCFSCRSRGELVTHLFSISWSSKGASTMTFGCIVVIFFIIFRVTVETPSFCQLPAAAATTTRAPSSSMWRGNVTASKHPLGEENQKVHWKCYDFDQTCFDLQLVRVVFKNTWKCRQGPSRRCRSRNCHTTGLSSVAPVGRTG